MVRWWRMLLGVGLLMVLGGMMRAPFPAMAGEPLQAPTPFPTPTPLPDGRIIYVVQPGDTPWRIAAIAGITVEQLYALNNLTKEDVLRPGQALLLGYALPGFPTPTPGPSPTPSPLLPTPTKVPGFGTICVFLYHDGDGNGMYDEDTEVYLAGGTVSIRDRRGQITQTATTRDDEAVCFENVPVDMYSVSIGVPQGFNPTTRTYQDVQVLAGNTVYVSFGAQPGRGQDVQPKTPENPSLPTWVGVVGLGFLVAGGGLWWMAFRLRQRSHV